MRARLAAPSTSTRDGATIGELVEDSVENCMWEPISGGN